MYAYGVIQYYSNTFINSLSGDIKEGYLRTLKHYDKMENIIIVVSPKMSSNAYLAGTYVSCFEICPNFCGML